MACSGVTTLDPPVSTWLVVDYGASTVGVEMAALVPVWRLNSCLDVLQLISLLIMTS